MTSSTGPSKGLDILLRQVKQDLRHLPRHEWDSYLWNFCSRLVRLSTIEGARPTNGTSGAERED
jgi:hypothetical protein